jgi:hypothetical protein
MVKGRGSLRTAAIARKAALKPRGKNNRSTFSTESFLEKSGVGKQVLELNKKQIIFAQGDPADSLFYIQSISKKAGSGLLLSPKSAKKQPSRSSGPDNSAAKNA